MMEPSPSTSPRVLVVQHEDSCSPALLGVCLGHQLIACACGGVVARNPRGRQLGVLTMGRTDDAAGDPLIGSLAATSTVGSGSAARCLQWNQDIVVDLPHAAVVLAQTAAGEPQLVRSAPLAWGIQAHPEVDRAIMQLWADDEGEGATGEVVPHDVQQAVTEVGASERELEATWRPVAETFAALVVSEQGSRSAAPSW